MLLFIRANTDARVLTNNYAFLMNLRHSSLLIFKQGSTPSNETNATNPEDLTGNYNATGSTTEPQITILEPLGTLGEL